MKKRNWDRLRDGDKIIGKDTGHERIVTRREGKALRTHIGLLAHIPSIWRLHPDTKARLRALDAPPADPAPVPLTAEDLPWLMEGDWLIDPWDKRVQFLHYAGFDDIDVKGNKGRCYGWDTLTLPPATAALIAQRKASATLAVGDTVETLDRARLADDTICAASPAPGAVGTIEAITTAVDGKPYKVRFSTGSPDYWYYPASSLRRVQPAAGYVAVSCLRHGTRNCPDCFGIAAPAEQPGRQCFFAPYEDCQCQGECCEGLPKRVTPTCEGTPVPAEQPDPAADLRREIEARMAELTQDERQTTRTLMDIFEDAIRAAAAVEPSEPPRTPRPGESKLLDMDVYRVVGCNAGIKAVQRAILAALQGDTHEQG